MMVRILLLAISCALLPFSTVTPDKNFDYQSQVGMFEFLPGDSGCLTIKDASLKKDASVDVILLKKPQVRTAAVIQEKLAKACPHETASDPADSSYRLRIPPMPADEESVGITIVGFLGKYRLRDGLIRADLSGDDIEDSFRICAGAEGLHLTVWNGEPLISPRKWHRYLYLGYDVEPNCTEKEY